MLTKRQAEEILLALRELPAEKVAEAQDFIRFLRERYGQGKALDEGDSWSEEDLRDLTTAALNYADQTL